MAEIWNLSALCRCCLKDGYFRQMNYPYDGSDVYSVWLQDTFGITMSTPCIPASDMICEDCVASLRAARLFKRQVQLSETQFQQYCMNEATTVKVEPSENDQENAVKPQHPDHDACDKTAIKDESGSKLVWDDNSYDGDDFNEPQIISELTMSTEIDTKSRQKRKKALKSKNPKRKDQESVTTKRTKSVKSEDQKPKRPKREKPDKPKNQKLVKKSKQNRLKTESEWKCNTCQEVCLTSESLRLHKMSAHSRLPKVKATRIVVRKLYEANTVRKFNTRCAGCSTDFESNAQLKEHEKASPHCGGRRKTCAACNEVFRALGTYNLHMNKFHPDLRCAHCVQTFPNRATLRAHVNREHAPTKSYICDFCSKEFRSRSVLIRHINQHTGLRNRYPCHICGHVFNDTTNVRKHVQQVHENIRAHQCEYCIKNYKTKKALVEHTRRKHTLEKPFACQMCSQAFVSGYELNIHLNMHKEAADKEHQCEYCPKSFTTKQHILQHTRLEHSDERPFACDVCPLSFVTKYQLDMHVHDDQVEEFIFRRPRNYKCFVCQHVTHSRTDHRKHLKDIHNCTLPYPCDQCDKAFANKYILVRHKLVHTNNEVQCDYCAGIFKHEYLLELHIKRIHGKRHRDGSVRLDKEEFTRCDLCNKLVRNMVTHQQMHSKRPFKCGICFKTYAAKNALRRHIKDSHLKVFQYKCDLCCKKSVRLKAIQKHRRKKHPDAQKVDDDDMLRIKNDFVDLDNFISANDE